MADVPVATMHVLVLDPDPGSVDLVRLALDDACVQYAPDAYCALNDLESGPVDLIVMELCLPGASAVEFLTRLRAHGHHVPVVGLSHLRGPSAELRDLGVATVLAKPISLVALAAAVHGCRAAAVGVGTFASRRGDETGRTMTKSADVNRPEPTKERPNAAFDVHA